MEEGMTVDNDCPCYLLAVLDSEVMRVVLMKGHNATDAPYAFIVCTFISEECKEEHPACCDILLSVS